MNLQSDLYTNTRWSMQKGENQNASQYYGSPTNINSRIEQRAIGLQMVGTDSYETLSSMSPHYYLAQM